MSRTVLDVLKELGYRPQDGGQYYRVNAFFRNSTDFNIAIDKRTGFWSDFARGTHGDLDDLVLMTGGEDIDLNTFLDGVKLDYDPQSQLIMPKVYNPEMLSRLFPNFEYWKTRTERYNNPVSEETLRYFKNGLSHTGKMYLRSVFPIVNPDGKIYGFSGRLVVDGKDKKWKHIGKKSVWVYPYYFNEKYIHEAKKVILVESIGDMLSLWEAGIRNTLVLFSVSIGSGLFKKLIELDYDIDICLNNDNDSNYVGNKASMKNFAKMSEFFGMNRLRIRPPTKNDFGCMSHDDILEWDKMEFNSFELIKETAKHQKKPTEAEKKLLRRIKEHEFETEN